MKAVPIAPVLELLARRAGLHFPANRRDVVRAAAERGMERTGVGTPEHYLAALTGGGAVFDELVADVTVGETYFFREPEQLEFVRQRVLPELALHHAGGGVLRAWSAGCATGEEAYTLAMLLDRAGLGARTRIVGTDISRPRLLAARAGRYRRWSFRGTPAEIVDAYFERRGETWTIAPAMRRAVEFRYLNLAEDVYPSLSSGVWGMDLVLCRNVLIYFDRDIVQHVARRLLDSLSEHGWLVLGASDPMLDDLVACDVVRTGSGIAYRRRRRAAGGTVAGAAGGNAAGGEAAGGNAAGGEAAGGEAAGGEAAGNDPASRRPAAVSPAAVSPAAVPPAAVPPASEAYARHDYATAAERAAAALRRGERDVELHVLLVRALANQGRLEEAGRACAAALEQERLSPELTYLHAVLLAQAGSWQESASAARRALYLDRGLVVAHVALGTALGRLGDRDGARRALRSAARLLEAMPAAAPVPAADGTTAERLREMLAVQLELIGAAA